MRWQRYGFEWNDTPDYSSTYSLEELYEMLALAENHLSDLRESEPSSKRRYEEKHRVWFSQCQGMIDDIKAIRDAIVEKKNRCGKSL